MLFGLFDDDPFGEDINLLDWESLEEDDVVLKYFIWSRKIEEHIFCLEDQEKSAEEICQYLQKCVFLREKFLDADDLTEIEEHYMEKIQPLWKKYQTTDPIFRN